MAVGIAASPSPSPSTSTLHTMRATIRDASRLTVEESGYGPIFRPERQGPGTTVEDSPAAKNDLAATEYQRPESPVLAALTSSSWRPPNEGTRSGGSGLDAKPKSLRSHS